LDWHRYCFKFIKKEEIIMKVKGGLKMKGNRRLAIFISFVFIGALLSTSIGFTNPIYEGDIVILKDGTGTTNGGEFEVYKDGALLFNTFCVEKDEYISFNTEYLVADISGAAIAGGSGGPSPDPLDPFTAYLYYHFRIGDLEGYTNGNSDSANALQIAIWYIELELGGIDTLGELRAYNPKALEFYNVASSAGWTDIGNIRVMNLTSKEGGIEKQSQLVLVPEPSTLLLLGAGLFGLGFLGRKKFKAR